MKSRIIGGLVLMLVLASSAPAWGQMGWSVDGGATYATAYVWRGMPLNLEAVVQPSLTISQGDFSLNGWGNVDTTDWGESDGGYGDESGNLTEFDYTASWSHSFDAISVGGGFATYTFPSTDWPSTTEIFANLSADVPLSPSLTYYIDVDGPYTGPSSYLSLDLGHSFTWWESGEASVGLDLMGHVGYGSNDFNKTYELGEGDGWNDWSAGAALPIGLGSGFALTPAYIYSSLIDDDVRDEVEDGWDREVDNGVLMVSLSWSGEI